MMAKAKNNLVTKQEEDFIEVEENLVADFQLALHALMEETSMSRADLAKILGVSKARITQLLGHSANPTLRTAARAFWALGERCTFSTPRTRQLLCRDVLDTDVLRWQLTTDENGKSKRSRHTPEKPEHLVQKIRTGKNVVHVSFPDTRHAGEDHLEEVAL